FIRIPLTLNFGGPSPASSRRRARFLTFMCLTRPIETLGKSFDSTHHILNHWFLLEKDDLTDSLSKGIGSQFEPLIYQQQKILTLGSSHFRDFSFEILWVPEANQLDDNLAVFIIFINEHKVWHHDGVS